MQRPRRLLPVALALAVLIAPAGASSRALGDDHSPEYRESLRKTAERRKQRRQRGGREAVGSIVPYPMPPALIIRQTSERHDEILGLLRTLRGM